MRPILTIAILLATLALLVGSGCSSRTVTNDATATADQQPAADGDGTTAPTIPCSCDDLACPDGWHCLLSQIGGMTPSGVQCSDRTGLPECRPLCEVEGQPVDCPADRPHCIEVQLTVSCCSDALVGRRVCCANADAQDHTDCL